MSSTIIGIPTARVTEGYIRLRMLTQVQFDQAELFRIQTQLSTGHRFEVPSEDPIAAQRVASLQSLLQRKTQVKTNLGTNQSYLSATDTALGNISDLLTEVRATALGVIGTTATDTQRNAAAQQIQQALSQIVDTGNQKYRGRYLFAGSDTQVKPFRATTDGYVEYLGDEGRIPSYGDIDQLFDTNVNGSEAFGAVSEQVRGIDIQPALTYDTRLADLHHGAGVTAGSIAVSDGHSTSTIDISKAETMSDVAALIRAHPPENRTLEVEVTPTGLVIKLNPNPGGGFPPGQDNLSVSEVGGGQTARELGILRPKGVGVGPLVGDPLDPAVRSTTALTDILGTRAMAFVHVGGRDNDMVLDAKTNGETTSDGTLLNGVTVHFVGDLPPATDVIVDWAPGIPAAGGIPGAPGTITVHVRAGETRAEQVIDAINHTSGLPFTARIDPSESVLSGKGMINPLPADTQTAGGGGEDFDQAAGLQIVSRAKTFTIDVSAAATMEDVVNTLNGAGAGMLAEINQDQTGLNLRCRTSGSDFMIGENGGKTATQLGLRTFTGETLLADLNFGRGVNFHADQPGALQPTYDLSIHLDDGSVDGVTINMDLSGTKTIDEVCQKINFLGGGMVQAGLNTFGNGIQLINTTATPGTVSITCDPMSTAAVELGLVPAGSTSSTSPVPPKASVQVAWGANSGLFFQARAPGEQGNVQVVFVDDPALHGAVVPKAVAHYDPVAGQLIFQIADNETTANDVMLALTQDVDANAAFSVAPDPPTSTGAGVVSSTTVDMTGGEPGTLTGSDVHPLETDSIFNALLRLQHALERNDNAEAQRTIDLLDHRTVNMTFSRAELGARQQGIDVMNDRIDIEEIDLRTVMSNEYDADLAEVVSNLTARQVAYEASLRAAGAIYKVSLLNYL